jgi:hypothetical protein
VDLIPRDEVHIAPAVDLIPRDEIHIAPEVDHIPRDEIHIGPEVDLIPRDEDHIAPEEDGIARDEDHIAPEVDDIARDEPDLGAEFGSNSPVGGDLGRRLTDFASAATVGWPNFGQLWPWIVQRVGVAGRFGPAIGVAGPAAGREVVAHRRIAGGVSAGRQGCRNRSQQFRSVGEGVSMGRHLVVLGPPQFSTLALARFVKLSSR